MFCTDLTFSQQISDRTEYRFLKCKRWSCPHCSKIRRWQLKNEAKHGEPNTFITLTVNPKTFSSPDKRALHLAHAWRKLRRSAISNFHLKEFPFLAVFEKTEKGEPHLHILCRLKWLPQKWISQKMKELINAPIVDIRRVNSKPKMAAYVAKYVGKDPEAFKGVKRYWRSFDYFLNGWSPKDEKPVKTNDFNVERNNIVNIAQTLFQIGYTINWFEGGFWVKTNSPDFYTDFKEDLTPEKRKRKKIRIKPFL